MESKLVMPDRWESRSRIVAEFSTSGTVLLKSGRMSLTLSLQVSFPFSTSMPTKQLSWLWSWSSCCIWSGRWGKSRLDIPIAQVADMDSLAIVYNCKGKARCS